MNGAVAERLVARARDVDLLALLERDGVRLKKVATTRGGEYAGPCPFCGGVDRFRVQPERRAWWCRHCSPDAHWEDAIAYVMRRDRLDFLEAVGRLAGEPWAARADRPSTVPPAPPLETSPVWQERAARLAAGGVAALWSPAGERALAYLRGRGLTDDVLVAWGVGFHPAATTEPAAAWGRTGPAVRLPRGILLPWRDAAGRVEGIKVRLATPPDAPTTVRRYDAVAGSHFAVFGLEQLGRGGLEVQPDLPPARDALLLAEGEPDVLTGWQEAGDFLDVATLGGAAAGGGGAAPALFARYRHVLVAYDVDANGAGQRGSARLAARSARARRLALPPWVTEAGKKDLNEAHTLGGPGALREWLADVFLELVPPGEGLPEACGGCGAPVAVFTAAGEARCAEHGAGADRADRADRGDQPCSDRGAR